MNPKTVTLKHTDRTPLIPSRFRRHFFVSRKEKENKSPVQDMYHKLALKRGPKYNFYLSTLILHRQVSAAAYSG